MKRNLKHWYMTWALMLGLVAGVCAQSAEKFASVQPAAKADDMGKQTFKRKSGEDLTFQQIRELPNTLRTIVLDEEMSEAESEMFIKYMKSRTATAEARLEEQKKANATAEARLEEQKKANAAAIVQAVKSFQQLAANLRKVLAAGIKLPISFTTFSESVAIINDEYLKAGLSKEEADFLKSLLKRPELFEK